MSKRKSKTFSQRKRVKTPKARKFNGQRFQFDNEFSYKGDAQKKAVRLRRAGYKARVTKTSARGGGWRVYRRVK